MSQQTQAEGHCLCRRVQVRADSMALEVGACHCTMCRRWGGGPFVEVHCGTAVHFSGEEHIRLFSSSDWAERGFCSHCGTHLFYRLKHDSSHIMPAGLFGDDPRLKLTTQVFVDEQPHYYQFANDTLCLTGEQVFEQFSGDTE
ncbi:MAG: GFA family protein [Pseudomonadota bacterium]|nr:GFA family protein [Pseudomonadota bacterium]